MAGSSAVHLRKWYLDLTTPSGDAVIVYQAALRWRALRLRYASVLVGACGGAAARSWTTLRPGVEPLEEGRRLQWSCERLKAEGSWTRNDAPIARTLLRTAAGAVEWNCVMPAAQARVVLEGRSWEGLGYAEVLDLTIPPWVLPITELRWGRFLAPGRSVVWIEWRGPERLSLAWVNGVEHAAAIDDDGVATGGLDLRLDRARVLRSGRLGATVLGKVPGLAGIVPAPLMRTEEIKWVSDGVLRESAGEVRGWAIHERVVFGEAGR